MTQRALLVIDRFGSGGAQTQLALLCRGMRERGISVSVFTYHQSQYLSHHEHLEGARLVEHIKSSRSGVDVVSALAREIRGGDFDCVIAFLVGSCAYASLACLISGYKGVLIVGERNTFPGGRPTWKQWLQRLGHHVASFVVANSDTQRQALSRYFPWLSPRLRFIPNAVDTDKFVPGAEAPPLRLLAVARVVREKNALGFAKALARVHAMGATDVTVDWVGKVHDESYFLECQQAISELGIASHWTWHPETADVLPFYHRAHALVLPSFHEGMPNVVCEALACGVPCAISNLPESSWLADGGNNGNLFDPVDTESIASALFNLCTLDRTLYDDMRIRSRAFAKTRLSVSRMTDDYLDLVRSAHR